MTDAEKLIDLINRAAEDIEHTEIKAESLSPEYCELGAAICSCLAQVKEVNGFIAGIADGELDGAIPPRSNYLAGPSKDLYYKLKHLTWQANQVARGDYSQRVDFLGSFSESFNYMITELDKREKEIRKHAEERVLAMQKENDRLKSRSERLMSHYHAYRDYIQSFQDFRNHYKLMMGEVYALFDEGKYDEGRLLIAKINDMMASEVIIGKEYSNHDFVNATLTDIDRLCRARDVAFRARVYIPPACSLAAKYSTDFIIDMSELTISLIEIPSQHSQTIDILSQVKDGWLSIHIHYHAVSPSFPAHLEDAVPSEIMERINRIETTAAVTGSMFHIKYSAESRDIDVNLHVRTAR